MNEPLTFREIAETVAFFVLIAALFVAWSAV